MRVHITDYETQNHEHLGNIASPLHPENYIVEEAGEDIIIGGGEVQYLPRWCQRYESREEWLEKNKGIRIHEDTQIIVAHNLAYEASWWLTYFKDEFMAFLKRGGRVYCTAYAHYLLSNQQDTYPALDDVAPLYGGSHKIDGVKALWEAGVLTSDIDPELLHEYLYGPEGDIANTTKVFLGTWEKLRKRGMLKMALVRMDALLYSIFCMHHGLKIDRDKAYTLKEENEKELEKARAELETLLPEGMPQEAVDKFSWSSDYNLSALLFGGPMKYPARVERTDSEGNLIYKKAEGPFFKDGKEKYVLPESKCEWDEEVGLWYDPERKIHQARYTAGKNKGEPKFEKYVTDEVDTKNGDLLFEMPGLIDEDNRVKLADAMANEWTGKRTLPDGSPVYSTSGDVLDVLAAHDVPGAKLLQHVAKVDKDLGAFYLKVDYKKDGTVKKTTGMLQYLSEDDFINHTLNHTSTVTGRLSSNKPNLQQLPRGDTSRVKEMFVSRFGDDGVVLQEDYSALETVGLQVLTGDQNLKAALLEGKDMHSIRLASMEGLDYEYVVARTKDHSHPDHSEWDVKRTHIKPVAFQYQYGATAYGMAMSTGKSKDFCEQFIQAEKTAFPEVEEWFEGCVFKSVEDTSLTNKPIRLEFGEGRYKMIRWGTFTTPDGTTYQFRQQTKQKWDSIKKKHVDMSEFRIPQMRNYPVQGTSGFFVQLSCAMLIRYFIKHDFYNGLALPINTVHDANYFDCHKSVLRQTALAVECIMESIPEVMNSYWPEFNCEVPFPVAGGAGPSMAVEACVYSEHNPKTEPELYKADKEKWMQERRDFKREFLAEKGIEVQF
ncbi:DNA-directed DNA polymerase [Vibrio phage vB_VpaP_G1]|uniref:DNA-directed DNA polymerase n=1 Tax=Vibrio phage vB_VpaP_G1 TaxID=2862773 RepID=A0AAE7WW92_9CAUD|nr:DNA-directed DNA polymerase [Vibrio phage vB_VpaP_G1]QYW05842.1 DNA-directed DNA polymerase [Vibrio phage vB_VpaP_G1]